MVLPYLGRSWIFASIRGFAPRKRQKQGAVVTILYTKRRSFLKVIPVQLFLTPVISVELPCDGGVAKQFPEDKLCRPAP